MPGTALAAGTWAPTLVALHGLSPSSVYKFCSLKPSNFLLAKLKLVVTSKAFESTHLWRNSSGPAHFQRFLVWNVNWSSARMTSRSSSSPNCECNNSKHPSSAAQLHHHQPTEASRSRENKTSQSPSLSMSRPKSQQAWYSTLWLPLLRGVTGFLLVMMIVENHDWRRRGENGSCGQNGTLSYQKWLQTCITVPIELFLELTTVLYWIPIETELFRSRNTVLLLLN